MKLLALVIASLSALPLLSSATTAQEQEMLIHGQQPVLPLVDPKEFRPLGDAYNPPPATMKDRWTIKVDKTKRGTSVPIPEDKVIEFCSGADGCIVRLGMHNWDDTGRVASRHFLFFYNKDTKVWRSEFGDWAGANSNNVTEHVAQVFACYFTDGAFSNWRDNGDTSADFGLLSWDQYNADCFLTLVR